VDAAIGSALCIGVVSSHSAGIGGGGMMVIYNGTAAETIDSRETAPAAATERMFADFTECAPHGGLNDSTRCPSRFGGLSVAVPGELRGFEKAHQRHGKLPWRDVLAPTIILCRDGFRVTGANARAMWITHSLFERVGDEMRSTFTRRGDVFQEGDLMRRPRLARTLALVAERGADAFYTGPVAENTIDTIMHNSLRPGIMTLADLAGYQPIVRDVTSMAYQGNTVLSAPPPASGAVLGLILNILEGFDLNCIEGPSTLTDHRIVEAMKFGYGFRSLVADPCCDTNTTQCRHVQTSVAKMLSKPEGRRLQSLIRDGVTHHNPQYYGGHFDVQDTPGTTHISVVGPAGDAVAFTSTINTYFGRFDPVCPCSHDAF
jgi:gamma-glutamyltranspeptidase/glutathione hydrolase/leukotriene-C4 hydrolase